MIFAFHRKTGLKNFLVIVKVNGVYESMTSGAFVFFGTKVRRRVSKYQIIIEVMQWHD